MTIIEHLEEVRKRIIISLIALSICGGISFLFAKNILETLKKPASGMIERLVYFSPPDAFLVYMKVAFFCGLILSMPIILYEVWAFLSPAIGKTAKRFTISFIFFTLITFIMGIVFAYYTILPISLKFLLGFARGQLEPVISVNRYVSFVICIILGTGFVFQMPVLSFILTKLGIINARLLIRKFKYIILAIFIIAAIITPTPDIFNMFVFAVPMFFLYAVSIAVSKFAQPR